MCSAGPPRRLRIVALHGWGTNGSAFSAKIGALRTELKHEADFFFPDGPIELSQPPLSVPPPLHPRGGDQPLDTVGTRSDGLASAAALPPVSSSSSPVPLSQRTASLVPVAPGGRSWYDFSRLETGESATYDGIDACFTALAAYCDALVAEGGPLDGVIGFSQGAVVAAIWVARRATLPRSMEIRFAGFVSGLLPTAPELRGEVRTALSRSVAPPRVPHVGAVAGAESTSTPPLRFATFHVLGETDSIIEPRRSLDLAEACLLPGSSTGEDGGVSTSSRSAVWDHGNVFRHPGGHVVPSSCRKFVKSFLAKNGAPASN